MMRKYVDDAEKVIAADRKRARSLKLYRAAALHRVHLMKLILLGVALVGIAYGLYFAHDLGGMLATNVGSRQYAAPTVDAPVSKAKYMRKLSENRKSREEELEEIEKF